METKTTWGNPNDFSMVFRCTTSEYAKSFVLKGEIKFNTPESWVKWAQEKVEGRGDLLEGIIAGYHILDIDQFAKLYNKYSIYKDMFLTTIGANVYFRRKKTMELPCFCFYILKNNMFECPDKSGEQKLSAIIPPSYFKDFADNKNPDELKKIPDNKKPSIVFINDFKIFKSRLMNRLIELGLTENEIIPQQITYYDFHQYDPKGWFDLGQKSPYELTFKDIKFSHQNEARIIINTYKHNIIEFLTNNVIEIGPLTDIAQYKDVYLYEGMRVELTANVSDTPINSAY